MALRYYQVDEANNNSQGCDGDDTDGRVAFPSGGTLLLFLAPPLFFPASSLPGLLTCGLFTHEAALPFNEHRTVLQIIIRLRTPVEARQVPSCDEMDDSF